MFLNIFCIGLVIWIIITSFLAKYHINPILLKVECIIVFFALLIFSFVKYRIETFQTCSNVNFEFKCINNNISHLNHPICLVHEADIIYISYMYKNTTIVDSMICEKENCFDNRIQNNFTCRHKSNYIGIPYFGKNDNILPYSVIIDTPKYNSLRDSMEQVPDEFIQDFIYLGFVIAFCILCYDLFRYRNINNRYVLVKYDGDFKEYITQPQIEEIQVQKMPEKISALLPEDDRKCLICWLTIEINEVYTPTNCYCVYHKECFNQMKNDKCAVCKK